MNHLSQEVFMADETKGVAGAGMEERVKSLEEALSVEKAKNEVLMEQILKSEHSGRKEIGRAHV